MVADDWKKIKEVLNKVLETEIPHRRNFLEKAGLDAEMRREVELLLTFETEAETALHLPAIEFSKDFFDDGAATDANRGQIFGIYKVVRELGYGGMGAVYLAERADGKFEQKVALKLLKREMNTDALRRRFAQEREILASLEHPNIARLLDAGTTDDNIPYIAMEYVEGAAIDDYCDAHELDLNQRLDLFKKVCAAVNFAHRSLIVHRDLKPSNILVSSDGVPKLLDFGISKILSNEFETYDSATITRLGVMTPSYASPEQLQNKSVTTATDIYSLGVILYELLSGHRPFEAQESNLREIYKAVIEKEPAKPSSITNYQGEQNPKSKIQNPKSLKGDLDNIILKALRKEPARRYSSAENLAEDVQLYQKGLPVSARPNTFGYRTEKFIKRNRVSVAAGGLVMTAVFGGIVATLRQSRAAKKERKKAERRFNDVRKLANSYLFDVYPEIENLEGSLKAREKILRNALRYLDSLSNEAGDDIELQRELARAYEKIGEVQGAIYISSLGDINAGLESYEKAQKLREAVFRIAPENSEIKEDVAKNYHVIAQTLMWNIDTQKAEEYFEKAIKLRRELVADNPNSIILQNRLAVLLSDYSAIHIFNVQNEKASELLNESAILLEKILKNHPDHFVSQKAYPRVLRAYSRLKANTGDYAGAIRDLDQSRDLTEKLVRQKPADYTLRRTSWLNDFGYCEVFVAMRDGQKIVESGLKTIEFNLKTLEKEPNESFALYDLAINYYYIALGYRLSDEPRSSMEYGQKAIEMMKRLDEISPETIYYIRGFAVVETEIAASLLMLGETDEAFGSLDKAREKLEKVTAADQTVLGFQTELAAVYRYSAAALFKKGESEKAVEFIDRASAIISRLKRRNNLIYAERNLPAELENEKRRFLEKY